MSLTYILIDFENVQPTAADMGLIRGADYRVRLFHGPHQNRFDASMVKALQPLGSQLEYVQGELKGKNALDFQIAFYLGRLVEACKASVSPLAKGTAFVIVSKDAGFDALVGPFRAVGYRAARTPTVADAIAFAEAKDVRATSEPAGETGASSGKARAAKVVPSQSKPPPANPKAPIFSELCAIAQKTVGLAEPLRTALKPLAKRISAAFVYGSVAKKQDTAASDIDLMVVSGSLTYADLFAALEDASERLGRKVNPTVYSPRELAKRVKQGNAFVTRVLAQPKIWLIGGESDIAA